MLCTSLHCYALSFIPMLIAGLLFLSYHLHAPSDTAVCVLLRHAIATPHVTPCMSSYAAANFPLIDPPYFIVAVNLAVVQLAPSKSTCDRFHFIHAILSHPIPSLTSLTSRVMRRRSIFQFLSQRCRCTLPARTEYACTETRGTFGNCGGSSLQCICQSTVVKCREMCG